MGYNIMTNLEEFCEKNRLDHTKVKKEIGVIKKNEGISDLAAFNKWKTLNLAELAVRKRGKELYGLYLGNEHVGVSDYNENPFWRIYFLVFPPTKEATEGVEQPEIAYLKVDAGIIDDNVIFKVDPVPFEVWKIPFGYVSSGDKSKWIVASRVDGVPEMEKDEEFKPTNEQVHEALSVACKKVEDFYLDSLIEDQVSFNPLFYLQATGAELRNLKDGREITQYNFVDLTDEDSFVRVSLTDWEGDIEPIENYEHILIIGGYTKQRVQFKNALEIRYSPKVPIQIVHCPTIY